MDTGASSTTKNRAEQSRDPRPDRTRSPDPRPDRTRAAIFAAVDRLAESAGEVTVSSVAREAGVSRSAFYTQFTGLEEVLASMLGQAAAAMSPEKLDAFDLTAVGRKQRMRSALERLVDNVEEHAAFYTSAIGWKITMTVYFATTKSYADQIIEFVATERALAPHDPQLPPASAMALIGDYVGGGFISALTFWLRNDRTPSKPEFVEMLLAMLPEGLVGGSEAHEVATHEETNLDFQSLK